VLRRVTSRLIQAWFRLSRPMTLGVRVAAFDADGRVCLIRHTYLPGWHLPGGGVERGETALDCGVKELREEAGLVADPADLKLHGIFANFANFPGDHVLIYRCDAFAETGVYNTREIAEVDFFNPLHLPEDTTRGTRQRLAELAGAPVSAHWIS
jgi:8-oxo-dGTP pyrophosphatase MutT (NUDIX family)